MVVSCGTGGAARGGSAMRSTGGAGRCRCGSAHTKRAPTIKPSITHEGANEGLAFFTGAGAASAASWSSGSSGYMEEAQARTSAATAIAAVSVCDRLMRTCVAPTCARSAAPFSSSRTSGSERSP